MCLNPIEIRLPSVNSYRWLRGERSPRYIIAPCGRCLECLQARQNDLASRIYQESKTKSRMYFVTFTYAPEYEPLAGSVWRYDEDAEEARFYRVSEPVLLSTDNGLNIAARKYFSTLSIPKSGVTRIYESPLPKDKLSYFDDSFLSDFYNINSDLDLYLRVTPSLNIRDLRLAIKRWRVNYERNFGEKLPEFSYAAVGEFGTKRTRRPHYHLVLLSNELEKWQVSELTKEWIIGRTRIDVVPHYNSNGSDAFAAISRYIGKYISKGPFDVDSAKMGLVKGSRLCCSKHFGQTLTQREIDYFLCKDLKKYDQNLAFEQLSKEDLNLILPEIIRRLKYRIVTKKGRVLLFSMPQSLKKQIFNYHVSKTTHEASYSSLYYLVQDFVRSKYSEDCEREFIQFCASRPLGESRNKTVSLYEKFKEADRLCRKQKLSDGLQRWYNLHSKF